MKPILDTIFLGFALVDNWRSIYTEVSTGSVY